MIKGTQKTDTLTEKKFYTGFTSVRVAAINPTRAELNKLLDKESGENEKEFVYSDTDKEGNDRTRLTFWLKDENMENKYWIYSFFLTNKTRTSKDGLKTQYINNVCTTSWVDVPENLDDWFTKFLDKDKNEVGVKEYREALSGEDELAILLRSWLGRMTWSDPETSVFLDVKALIKEDFTEIRSLIESDYDSSFVVLLGVRTDENDPSKQYQQIYGKAFLPGGFINYINKGMKFPTPYSQKAWAKFEKDVEGEYGFKSYFELVPIKEYNKEDDVAAAGSTLADSTPTNKKY